MTKNKRLSQLIWGIMLILAGIGVFFRVHQVIPRIEKIEYFSSIILFIRFSFYLMGIILIGGGAKKIYAYLRKPESEISESVN